MSLPDINFDKIRAHDGSRNAGFEELCCQLASLEPRPATSIFFRKGKGGDAGVECFVRAADGKETGWQAKYVTGWSSALATQLDVSIATALEKHPKLTTYYVCLPFDLPDARPRGGQSPLQHWETWQAKWTKLAKGKRRSLAIILWSKSTLAEKLARDAPTYAGRLIYWFDQQAFSTGWFEQQFDKARAALGSRYTPDTNVELPIRRDFLSFARDPALDLALSEWDMKVQEHGHTAAREAQAIDEKGITAHGAAITASVSKLVDSFSKLPISLERPYPIQEWINAARPVVAATREALNWTYDASHKEKKADKTREDPLNRARHFLYQLSDTVTELVEDLGSAGWKMSNSLAVLLYGEAGTGKSHLLADVVEHQIGVARPAILVLGSMFVDGDPWRQILTQLDLPATLQVKQFLGALDAAAQAAGTRALLCVDALNERNGTDVWPTRLAAFLQELKPYPRVVVALSCRSTYLQYVVPDTIPTSDLLRIEHVGFSGHASEAAKVYLDKRGIVRPGAPNLIPEFENPLFLKTCCDYLQKEGKKELPKGLTGVTEIFGFYVDAITRALNARMKLDPHREAVPKALRALALAMTEKGSGYLKKDVAIALLDGIHPSHGLLDQSLLAQLESEGAIALEAVQSDDGSRSDEVRFTFERFSDHEIARTMLDKYLDTENPTKSFDKGTPLHELVLGEDQYKRSGIIEAIAVQLPERTKTELLDVVPAGKENWYLRDPFLESLLWRNQEFFTDRTFELLKGLVDGEELTKTLFSVATEPKNKFNAMYLHNRLMLLSMPERDERWTPIINYHGAAQQSAMAVLISWCIGNGMEAIEDDRAELAAIAISWLLTASNRAVRDQATKGLACLLANRLELAAQLIERFSNVNDLYVLERILTAAYGAVLQGVAQDGHAALASSVFDNLFAGGDPPVNLVVRDSALSILQYIEWRKLLPAAVNMKLARPPYRSDWPLEFVPDELIETYKEDHGRGEFRDSIVGSAVNDGDFARYQIDPLVHHWSQVRLGKRKLLTYDEVAWGWIDRFLKHATTAQMNAFDEVVAAAKANKGENRGYHVTPEIERLNNAERVYRGTISADEWEAYRVQAQRFLRYTLFDTRYRPSGQTALFDNSWARKWVCKRAHDLGWTTARFSKIERNMDADYSRNDHRQERIGKKYQWLAVYELAARLADNLVMLGYVGGRTGAIKYQGAWQVSLREMDPSLFATQTHSDGWSSWPKTWWVPATTVMHSISRQERLAWRDSDQDIINDPSLIDVRDPKTGRRWLVLDSFSHWRQSAMVDGRSELERGTWFRLNCIVARKKDRAALLSWLSSRDLTSSRDLPEIELHGEQFLGEYPWHSSLDFIPDWNDPDSWHELPVPTRTVVSTYSQERSGYDYSIEKSVKVALPAPWLMKSLGLRLSNGRSLTYVDKAGTVQFFDPSVTAPGPQAALVDRDAFLTMLDREKLVAFWVISGEKVLYSSERSHSGWGGRQNHTFVYELKNDGFTCTKKIVSELPTEEQLNEYLGHTPRVTQKAKK